MCSWGLITALLTNFAFGQSNFLNTFFDYNGQYMHGNHVKAVQIAGSQGYYVAGMYDGFNEAFIAKTDPYGNAYWVRKISNVTKQETVMEVDPANGNVYFSVQVNNRLEIYGFVLSGASVSTNFPIQFPGDFYPVAIKAFDNGGSNNFGVLSRSQTTNELHLSAFDGTGVIQFGRLYDAPGISANSRSASFVQNTTNNRLIIAYGSDAGTSSIVSFNVDETSGAPTGIGNYLYQEITDLGGHFGEITVHDIIPAGSDYLIAGSYNQTSMLALMNGTNSVLWSELLIGFIPHPEHQAVSLNTDGSHFYVMALGFSPYPNPASMHFLEVDIAGGLTINIANEIHISSPISFDGRTHYPASFAMNNSLANGIVFTAYQYDPSQGTPIVSLDANLDLNCQVVIHSHGLDPMTVTTPTSLPVPVVNSVFSPVNFSGSASNELPIPNHLCFSCGNTITLNPTVVGGLCAAGGGTANLQANPVGIANPIFIWYPDGQTTNAINVTTPGTYVVVVIDPVDGCFEKYDFIIGIDPPININPIITNEHCVGSLDGEILSNVSGGNPGYTYLWDDGTSTYTTADLTGLAGNPAVNYSLTVTDASGCTATVSGLQVLTNYPGNAITYSVSVTDAACPGSCNGEIEISSTVPGIANLTFNWSTGSTSNLIDTLCEGSYSVTINNAPIPFGPPNNCPYYETIVVGTNAPSNWQVFSENSSGNTEVVDVEKDDNNNVYVMGNFHGTAEFQGVTINSGTSPSGVYIAMYDQCGGLRWIAYTNDNNFTGSLPSYTARDMEFRDGYLHFMFHNDVQPNSPSFLATYNSSGFLNGANIATISTSNHTIGRIDLSGVFHDVADLVNPANWDSYGGPPDSLRAIDWFENTGNYVVAGRVDGRAFIAETNFGPNYTISTNRTDVSTTPQNGIDIVNDIEYYPDLDIHHIYLTGKFRNAGVLNGNLVNSPGQYDVFTGVMEINQLDSGFSIGGSGTIFYNNQSYATIYAEGVELDYRKVSGVLFDIYVVGNYDGDFIHPNGWGSIGNTAPNAFVTHLLNDFTLVSYISKVSFNDAPPFDNVRGTGVFVDEFDRVYAVGTYKVDQLEQIPGSYTQGGNINFTNMWNLCLNTNMSHRWINGGHNHADVKVSGVTAFNRNAYVGGSYDNDLNFYLFAATPSIPYAGIASYESFLARYGEHNSPGGGPFNKKEDTKHPEIENSFLSKIEANAFEVRIAPNPIMQQMQIQLKSDKQEAWNYSVYSLTGSLVIQSPNIPVLQNQVQWDAGSLPSGIYLLRVQQGENVQNIRFVKH